MEWYALFVETGREDYVGKWLELNFDVSEVFPLIPKRKLPEKKGGITYHTTKPLFPGYIILKTNSSFLYKNHYIIKAIPHVIKILQSGNSYSRIDEKEIHPMLKLLKGIDLIDYSHILIEDKKVTVKSGPLYGMEGLIKKVDKHKHRVKVLLNFMGEPRLIDLGVEIVQLVN